MVREFIDSQMVMRMKLYKLILFVPVLFFYFLPAQNPAPGIPQISFCDLPKYKDQIVRITCTYSGEDSYWGIGALLNEKCSQNPAIELNLAEVRNRLSKKNQKLLDKVHEKYWMYYLVLTTTGRFENSLQGNDKDPGQNSNQFIVQDIEEIRLVERTGR